MSDLEAQRDRLLMTASIGDTFLVQVRILREALLEHMVPAIPDAAEEAHRVEASLRKWMEHRHGATVYEDRGVIEYPVAQAIERFLELTSVRQSVTNMAAVMLRHLLEQQMVKFLRMELLTPAELQAAEGDVDVFRALCTPRKFEERAQVRGFRVTNNPAWSRLTELSLVANTVKHAAGGSTTKLHRLRPDLFIPPEKRGLSSQDSINPTKVMLPAAGEDLFLEEQDIVAYFDAAILFWQEFTESDKKTA